MPQFKKKKVHRYAMNIEKIVKINNVVNIKDYDDNEWIFKDKATTSQICQDTLIKKSNDEKR